MAEANVHVGRQEKDGPSLKELSTSVFVRCTLREGPTYQYALWKRLKKHREAIGVKAPKYASFRSYFRAAKKAGLVEPAYMVDTPPLKGNMANLRPAKKRIIYKLVPPPKGFEEREIWEGKWRNPQRAAWGVRRHKKRRPRGRPRNSKIRKYIETALEGH